MHYYFVDCTEIAFTISTSFNQKCITCHLAAGLSPDPLGELKRSPYPLAVAWRKGGNERRKGKERKAKDGKEGRK